MTEPHDGVAGSEDKDEDSLALDKETLEDLDAPEEAAEEAKGGTGTRTATHGCTTTY